MKSCSSEILKAWFDLLNGHLTVDGSIISVFRVTVDPNSNTHYILLAADSENNNSTNSSFGKDFYLSVSIVTRLFDQVDDSIVDLLDNQINTLLFPTDWNSTAIKNTANFHIVDITPQSATYIAEKYESNRFYIKRTLYKHIISE